MRARPLLRHFRQRSRSRGQSLVEFALVLPVFLVFLAAALDLGRVFYANITLNNAAREGAFQAALTPALYTENQACNQATNRVVCRIQNETQGSMVSVAPTDIDMTCSAGCAKAPGSLVTVEVRGKFRLITPLLSVVFGGQELGLTSNAIAQIEYLPDPSTATLPPGPLATFTADDPTNDTAPWDVTFDSSASTGDPTDWNWDFDGDGIVDSIEQNPTHTYTAEGTYTVTLTVINLTGANTQIRTDYVIIGTEPAPSASSSTPDCVNPPNVIGMLPTAADAALAAQGFLDVTIWDDLTSGPKGKVQAQDPDHTQCIAQTTEIRIHYRPNS
jgi:Flp pilus assembly protein TadG